MGFDKTDIPESAGRGFAATTGTFDGVHTGHLYLLRQLREYAERTGLSPLAIVLHPHPLQLVRPERTPRQLCDFKRRRQLIEKEGVAVVCLPFTEQTRRETSADFMRRLRDELGVKALLVGHDNRFGSDRENGFEHYLHTGEQLGIAVEKARCLPGVSSSAVRKLLASGNIAQGNRYLGYSYGFDGEVCHGEQLGRRLGYPTANITPTDSLQLIPPPGVYATLVSTDEKGAFRPSMTNIGYRPTVTGGNAPLSIETHILRYDDDLYGHRLHLTFTDRLRDERRFDTLEELKEQLTADEEAVRRLLRDYY